MESHSLAYTAGIIDGEGCITILEYKTKFKRNWRLTVSVVNTSEWLVKWLEVEVGFGIGYKIAKTTTDKQSWQWRVGGRKAGHFLRLILPYLKIKKPQAEIALRFQERRDATYHHRRTDGNIALDEAEGILIRSHNKQNYLITQLVKGVPLQKIDTRWGEKGVSNESIDSEGQKGSKGDEKNLR